MAPRTPRRILVVRTDRIGDVVLATPLIRALRRTFPQAYIAAMVRPYAAAVLAGNPRLDDVILDDPAGGQGFWRQVAALRRRRFDTALLLLPTMRLAWMLFFAGIGTRIGVGVKPYQVLTLMRTVSRRKYVPLRHEADYCLDLGRAIGVQSNDLATEVVVTEAQRAGARDRIRSRLQGEVDRSSSALVCIHPGSGGSAPNWRVERYVDLASMLLREPDVRIVLTGSPEETHFSEAFAELDPGRVADLIGELAVGDLAAVIACCSLVVSASTGAMHIAAGLGVPTVSMFCPLSACSPTLWGPRGNRSEVVLPDEGFCQGRCPGQPHVCDFEGGILPQVVRDRVVSMLRTAG